ncbi:ATP-binding protein [Rhizobium sp. XQZ8]|uniref:HD domain-containing protein n=1 Tax=Rhizobium populisoli TaxID=2859785 RepID=UPI001CA4EC77|nr:ATP-binding protein [Rhizobium populisoli]MBW6425928.1 ATP-binding protein [Rhizobium populisoli]
MREQHARRAEFLPFIEWKSRDGSRSLIENVEIRQKFGQFIGQIAASHWWDYESLANSLNRKIPAPSSFPVAWSVDLLKIATLLRCCDAAQIDERRAPGFLWALRKGRLSELSEKHWSFQNRLTQCERRGDGLYYASTGDFLKSESGIWWMLYDTLKMVDAELKNADALLARFRNDDLRFSARRVANTDSPIALIDSITVRGWRPVDTAFSISDIPRLVEKLGGEQLYGSDKVAPFRELVLNAMDAIRLRQALDPEAPKGLVRVELQRFTDKFVVSIHDNGVGMTSSSIVRHLLSFGSSGWFSDPAIGEFSDNLPKVGDVAGRFGIGFFSVFMLSKKVKVISRRFDEGANNTSILEFENGLDERPVMSVAEGVDRKIGGGTTICFEIDIDDASSIFTARISDISNFYRIILRKFPSSDIDICLVVDSDERYILGCDWRIMDASELLKRIEGKNYNVKLEKYNDNIRPIYGDSGEILARMCIIPDRYSSFTNFEAVYPNGFVVSQGAAIVDISFRGIAEGRVTRASRDSGEVLWSSDAIARWATEQARLIAEIEEDPVLQASCAGFVVACGGDPGPLKICEVSQGSLSLDELRDYLREKEKIWIAYDFALRQRQYGPVKLLDDVVFCSSGFPTISSSRGFFSINSDREFIREIVEKLVAAVFDIDKYIFDEYNDWRSDRAYRYIGNTICFHDENGKEFKEEAKFYRRGMNISDISEFKVDQQDLEF